MSPPYSVVVVATSDVSVGLVAVLDSESDQLNTPDLDVTSAKLVAVLPLVEDHGRIVIVPVPGTDIVEALPMGYGMLKLLVKGAEAIEDVE